MDQVSNHWRSEARGELLALKGGARGWGYRNGARPSVEPTVLACLALLAEDPVTSANDAEVHRAADWLVSIQGADGSLGLAEGQPVPRWTTPYGLILWTALGGREKACTRARAWLIGQKGRAFPRDADPERIVGHDTTIVGWPWVSDTHSWLEPTALAVMALRKAGFGGHRRVLEGLRLIRDRAIPGGGWNYGNKAAFGRPLRSQPAPTGHALLALAGGADRPTVVDDALDYLVRTLPETRAPASLGWGIVALRAWGRHPAEAPRWLAEAYQQSRGRPDGATRLALLLMASGEHAPALFAAAETGRSQ